VHLDQSFAISNNSHNRTVAVPDNNSIAQVSYLSINAAAAAAAGVRENKQTKPPSTLTREK